MIKIQPSGDYVQLIYVDPVGQSVQQELKSDTDAFECSYDSDGKLFLQFGAMRFENPDPTGFEIDGSAVTDAADFISKLNALFTGGGGGGSSLLPTTGTGTATGDIIGDLAVNNLSITGISGGLLSISQTDTQTLITQNQGSSSATFDLEGSIVNPHMNVEITDGTAHSFIDASSTTGSNVSFSLIAWESVGIGVQIKGDGITKDIAYTANSHTFNGETVIIPPTSDPHVVGALWNNGGTPAISAG